MQPPLSPERESLSRGGGGGRRQKHRPMMAVASVGKRKKTGRMTGQGQGCLPWATGVKDLGSASRRQLPYKAGSESRGGRGRSRKGCAQRLIGRG